MKARLVLLAKANNVGLARDWVEDNCGQFGVKGRRINDLKTITSEIVTNVVRHAYHGKQKKFVIKVKLRSSKLSIIVRDFGTGFKTSRTHSLHVGLSIVSSLASKVKIRKFGFGTRVEAIIYLKDSETSKALVQKYGLINHLP